MDIQYLLGRLCLRLSASVSEKIPGPDREQLVKVVKIVPLEVIVRNVAAGSFAKRYGVEEGTPLKQPTLEFCYKNDALFRFAFI